MAKGAGFRWGLCLGGGLSGEREAKRQTLG